MARALLVVILVILSIAAVEYASADPVAGSDGPPRSRLVTAMLERFANGYESFCFIGVEVSRRAKHGLNYRRFALAPSFYERFVEGQLGAAKVNQPGCPTPANNVDTCEQGCVAIVVYDATAIGEPTPWTLWPDCDREWISIFRSPAPRLGRSILIVDIYRNGLGLGTMSGGHNYLAVTETAPCTYLIQDKEIIE